MRTARRHSRDDWCLLWRSVRSFLNDRDGRKPVDPHFARERPLLSIRSSKPDRQQSTKLSYSNFQTRCPGADIQRRASKIEASRSGQDRPLVFYWESRSCNVLRSERTSGFSLCFLKADWQQTTRSSRRADGRIPSQTRYSVVGICFSYADIRGDVDSVLIKSPSEG